MASLLKTFQFSEPNLLLTFPVRQTFTISDRPLMHWKHDIWPGLIITGNLITMLRLLKNTTFSTAVHRSFDIMKNVKAIFETSDTRLLDALCDVNTWGKLCQTEVLEMALEKKIRFEPKHRNKIASDRWVDKIRRLVAGQYFPAWTGECVLEC